MLTHRRIGLFVILPLLAAAALVDDPDVALAISIVTFVVAVVFLIVFLRERRASR